MVKTGFLGNVSGPVFDTVKMHPGFELTGSYDPEGKTNGSGRPASREVDDLLNSSDAIVINHTGAGMTRMLARVLKQSKHVLLIDTGMFCREELCSLMKLHAEAETTVKIINDEKANPVLNECLRLISYPALFEVKYLVPDKNVPGMGEKTLLKILNTLLHLCPGNIQKIIPLRNPLSISDGLISARIEFDNGSVASVLSSGITDTMAFTIDIYRKDLVLRADLINDSLMITERHDGEMISSSMDFRNRKDKCLYDRVDTFYRSVAGKNTSGKDFYEISRSLDLYHNIIEKIATD